MARRQFIESHAGETAPNGMSYSALATRLRSRAAFRLRIWTDPLQSPDTFNEELWGVRPENRVPFPPRGTWPYCDTALDALEENWEQLFDEFKALNQGNLLHGKQQEEHEQGLQQYAFNTSMWFRSTFWRAGTCRNPAFKFSCALFQRLQVGDAWHGTPAPSDCYAPALPCYTHAVLLCPALPANQHSPAE